MTYVPEHLRNTAWYLFHKLYQVRVNPSKIRTVDEIKMYGTPTTGNEAYDAELAKNEEIVMLSIAQMEDIFNQGYPVKIVKREDTKDIYERIAKHLSAMKNITNVSENFVNDKQTLDELIRLDQFAEAMFHHARHQMKHDVAQSSLINKMRGGRFATLGRRRPAEQAAPTTKGGGAGRDYSTGLDAQQPDQVEDPRAVDAIIEDPSLPKRISLERLFEEQKRFGTGFGG